MDGQCHLSFTLLPDGTFAVDVGGHVPTWTRVQMGEYRAFMEQMLKAMPPEVTVLALQIQVPVQLITVHLTPGEVRDILNQASADLAHLAAKDMREAQKDFEG